MAHVLPPPASLPPSKDTMIPKSTHIFAVTMARKYMPPGVNLHEDWGHTFMDWGIPWGVGVYLGGVGAYLGGLGNDLEGLEHTLTGLGPTLMG